MWLEVLPGVVTLVGGIVVLVSRFRPAAVLGAWLAALAGAWFAVGDLIAGRWASLPSAGAPTGGATARRAGADRLLHRPRRRDRVRGGAGAGPVHRRRQPGTLPLLPPGRPLLLPRRGSATPPQLTGCGRPAARSDRAQVPRRAALRSARVKAVPVFRARRAQRRGQRRRGQGGCGRRRRRKAEAAQAKADAGQELPDRLALETGRRADAARCSWDRQAASRSTAGGCRVGRRPCGASGPGCQGRARRRRRRVAARA